MNQLPAHLQNRQSRNLATQAIGGISAGSPAHVSIADNRFTLVDGSGNEKPIQTLYLDVCVIDANLAVSKIFFNPRIPFEPSGDNSNPPICWSDNGIGASAQASQPQNASCQLCPQNVWGSAQSKATGKGIKACNDVKKVAVMVPGIAMPFLLRIPPASLKNWAAYCNTLGGHGVDLPDALTRIEFESQGVLKFTPVGYVDEATAAMTDKVIAEKQTDNLIGRNDRPWTGQGDAQKVAYAAQQPSQQALTSPAAAPIPPAASGFGAASPPPQPFGGAATAAPFGNAPSATAVPASPFGGAPTGVSTAGTAAQTATPFVQPAAEPPKTRKTRKPRTPKEPTAPVADDGIPPFLRREQEPTPQVQQAPPGPAFGMVPNPPAPDAGVQAALDAAFRLP